jgi:glycogen operon protein
MEQADWESGGHVLGMLINGSATDEVDERGRPAFGDTILLLLNGGGKSRFFALPKVEGFGHWQELVNTARPGPTRAIRGDGVNLVAHSLALLKHAEA